MQTRRWSVGGPAVLAGDAGRVDGSLLGRRAVNESINRAMSAPGMDPSEFMHEQLSPARAHVPPLWRSAVARPGAGEDLRHCHRHVPRAQSGLMWQAALRTLVAALVGTVTVVGCGSSGSTSVGPDHPSAAPSDTTGPATSSWTSGPSPTGGGSARRVLVVGRSAWVSVSVATLWRSPGSPRAVDAPALEHPVRIERWLADMSLAQRRALSGLADTQALLGDRVLVVRLRPRWAKVVVPSQPSPLDARGYPGWVPRRQITAVSPDSSLRRATVVARTAWLRTDQSDAARLFRVSFGTRLPVVGLTPRFVRVATPVGTVRRLARGAVVLHAAGEAALLPSRGSLVRTAKSFVGLPYLWAGASGFGLDCSGLTWLDHRVHGLRIPRDASPQSQHGRSVGAVRRGDLMFYATNGLVHHVSMYVGDGLMVHSPRTGLSVQVIATSTRAYADEYAGARRYLS